MRLGRTLGLVGGGAGLVVALGLGVFPTRRSSTSAAR